MNEYLEGLHSPVTDHDGAIIVDIKEKDFAFETDFNAIIGVVGDHNSNIVSFLLPKQIEGHSVADCAEHKVIWRTVGENNSGSYTLTADDITPATRTGAVDGATMEYTQLGWLISNEVTAVDGEIQYALCISDYDDNGQLKYRWKTKWGRGVFVEESSDDHSPLMTNQSFFTLRDEVTGLLYKLYVSNSELKMELKS